MKAKANLDLQDEVCDDNAHHVTLHTYIYYNMPNMYVKLEGECFISQLYQFGMVYVQKYNNYYVRHLFLVMTLEILHLYKQP